MSDPAPRTPNRWLSENVLIAALPLIGMYLVFLFQTIYLGHFNVPPSFIEIDIPKIVAASTAILIGFAVYVVLFSAVADMIRARHPFLRMLGEGALPVALFLPLLMLSPVPFPPDQLRVYVGALLVFGLLCFLPPPQREGENLGYWERMGRRLDDAEEARRSRSEGRPQRLSSRVFALISLAFFGSLFIFSLAGFFARNAGSHWVLASQPDAVFITQKGDSLVFVRYDRKTRVLKGELLILQNDSDNPLRLKLVETGPLLRPAKD